MAWTRHFLLLPAAGIAACAGATAGAGRASCPLGAEDSVYLARGSVYRECAVDKRAQMLDRTARVDFQPIMPLPGGQACYTAEVQFVVDPRGVPEADTITVIRTNSPAFAQTVVAAVPRWRYSPAQLHGVAVRQIMIETVKIRSALVTVRAGETPRPPVRGAVC